MRTTRSPLTLTALLAVVVHVSCSSDPDSVAFQFSFDFASAGQAGFIAGFADYPPGDAPIYELASGYQPLPAPLTDRGRALFIGGTNRSDDLFMYWTRQIALQPETRYRVRFQVELATNAPMGCVGVGGSPGEGVTVKVGASVVEPVPVLEGDILRMNIDKGNQTTSGADAIAVGDVANSQNCAEEAPRYELKTLSSDGQTFEVMTDSTGVSWILMGTDSGFEARSEIYYTRFVANFTPI